MLAEGIVLNQERLLPTSPDADVVPAETQFNCYAYALGHFKEGAFSPGFLAKSSPSWCGSARREGPGGSSTDLESCLELDGLVRASSGDLFSGATYDRLVSVFCERRDEGADYHVKRLDARAGVSHKLGGGYQASNPVVVERASGVLTDARELTAAVTALTTYTNPRTGEVYDLLGLFFLPVAVRTEIDQRLYW